MKLYSHSDQHGSVEVICPICNKFMLASDRKRAMKEEIDQSGKKYFYGCITCFMKEFPEKELKKVKSMLKVQLEDYYDAP